MSDKPLLTDEMRAAVGREFRWTTAFPIEKTDIRKWAIAIYYPEPPPRLFWDEAFAAKTKWGGIIAPEDFNPFAWMVAEERSLRDAKPTAVGPEEDLGLPTLGTRANVVAGIEVEYTKVRMRPGDVMRSTSYLDGYEEKQGRMGLMLFTKTGTRW